ncbi:MULTISPECIES: phosphonate ABC transporter substrate-binding protein [Pseudomonas]|mgnify:FL=1|jgi:phosphonate transport system substrate-binding protein|uniref:Phosphonate ABC transporter substrate-binding protein n=1 Tax=Pseudomonas kielensis TaxID=2762577 RepID=A0A7X1L101_9PSED|nr:MULTISPECIES: phosphonate ABC transporter substrate-binding protein [Pseudomonas]MBC2693446.1 phosphonate ABC transporter substrate-binding protein [Pseudomonas kielensis]NBB37142.1 phosphonate ABC transporter substrate-binding protein [Pseudomonas sp. BC115LW]UZM15434.1 phosphonate ABC transporter substrate-binding protein [Pseudomonas kielensis]WKL52438.1 phosphonate ABC transporter substrate-binding protein [Pseudomonas kielensis]
MKPLRSFLRVASIALTLTAAGLASAKDQLTIGLIPSEDSQAMIEASKQVLSTLESRLGMPVVPFVATDYNGIIEALRAGKLDVAYLGPFSYVLATSVANVEAFAVAVTRKTGQSAYKSVIVARKDSGIRELADLKGRTFAFVDPSSASGHLFPKAGLEQAGFVPAQLFSRVIFSGSHDASILAVENRKVDAAAVADRIFASAVSKGLVKQDDFQVVWSSRPIPESPMVWRKDLDPALQQKVASALASIKDVPWGDQGVLDGFQPTSDAAYDVVRDTAKVLDLDLRSMK